MGRGTKSTEFLKECMADALLRLMREYPIGKITVKDITAAAGVGRATWFRNFSSKEDAIAFKIIQMWKCWTMEHAFSDRELSRQESVEVFFRFHYSSKDIFSVIYKENMQRAIFDAYYEILSEILKPLQAQSALAEYQSIFFACGIAGILTHWVKCGYQESVEEMTQFAMQTMGNMPG